MARLRELFFSLSFCSLPLVAIFVLDHRFLFLVIWANFKCIFVIFLNLQNWITYFIWGNNGLGRSSFPEASLVLLAYLFLQVHFPPPKIALVLVWIENLSVFLFDVNELANIGSIEILFNQLYLTHFFLMDPHFLFYDEGESVFQGIFCSAVEEFDHLCPSLLPPIFQNTA